MPNSGTIDLGDAPNGAQSTVMAYSLGLSHVDRRPLWC